MHEVSGVGSAVVFTLLAVTILTHFLSHVCLIFIGTITLGDVAIIIVDEY